MCSHQLQQEQAARFASQAVAQTAAGEEQDALHSWWQAVLWYAEAYRLAEADEAVTAALTRARAEACRQYGEALTRVDQHPEAASVFQEAADLYGQLSGAAEAQWGRECARKALASVAALRGDPRNRLYLLIVRHARQQQQLALQPGTWAQQANCCLHIAQIFLRRDRPEEAYGKYREALELYRCADPTEAVYLSQAECHHRLGNLLTGALVDAPNSAQIALAHYDAAIALYKAHEPEAYGRQENCALCVYARADLSRRLEN